MTRLRVITGPDHGAHFDLGDPRIVIGRDLDCQLRFPDSLVSRHHAELVLQAGSYRLRDLGSTNGCFVNGKKVSETLLNDGDTIRLADVELAVETSHAAAPATEPKPSRRPEAGAKPPEPAAKKPAKSPADHPKLHRPPLPRPAARSKPDASANQPASFQPSGPRGVWRPPKVSPLTPVPTLDTKPKPTPASSTTPPSPRAAERQPAETPPTKPQTQAEEKPDHQPAETKPAAEPSAPPDQTSRPGLLGRLRRSKHSVDDKPVPPPKPPPGKIEETPPGSPTTPPKPIPKPVPAEETKRPPPPDFPRPQQEKSAAQAAAPVPKPPATPKPQPKPEPALKPPTSPAEPKPATRKPAGAPPSPPASPPAAQPRPKPKAPVSRPTPRPVVRQVPAKQPAGNQAEARVSPRHDQPIQPGVALPSPAAAQGEEPETEWVPLFTRVPFAIGLLAGILLLIAGYYGESHALIFWGVVAVVVGSLGTIHNWSPLPPKQRP